MGIRGARLRPLADDVLELALYNYEGDQAQNLADLLTATVIVAELMDVSAEELAAAVREAGHDVHQAIANRPDVFGPRTPQPVVWQ
jgi:NTP pyrophosphatase (non-canonical NTP hydrolase)